MSVSSILEVCPTLPQQRFPGYKKTYSSQLTVLVEDNCNREEMIIDHQNKPRYRLQKFISLPNMSQVATRTPSTSVCRDVDDVDDLFSPTKKGSLSGGTEKRWRVVSVRSELVDECFLYNDAFVKLTFQTDDTVKTTFKDHGTLKENQKAHPKDDVQCGEQKDDLKQDGSHENNENVNQEIDQIKHADSKAGRKSSSVIDRADEISFTTVKEVIVTPTNKIPPVHSVMVIVAPTEDIVLSPIDTQPFIDDVRYQSLDTTCCEPSVGLQPVDEPIIEPVRYPLVHCIDISKLLVERKVDEPVIQAVQIEPQKTVDITRIFTAMMENPNDPILQSPKATKKPSPNLHGTTKQPVLNKSEDCPKKEKLQQKCASVAALTPHPRSKGASNVRHLVSAYEPVIGGWKVIDKKGELELPSRLSLDTTINKIIHKKAKAEVALGNVKLVFDQ